MFCKTCGKEMADGVQFCPGCGAAVQPQPGYAPPPGQQQYVPPVQPQPGYAPPPKKGLSRKMLLIIIIAAAAAAALILMGVFGVFGDSKTDKAGVSAEDDIDETGAIADTGDTDGTGDMDGTGDTDGTGGTNDTDIHGLSDDDIIYGWPSSELPPGFPEYPNGYSSFAADNNGVVLVYIDETDKKTFDSYMDSLESLGFGFFLTNAENVYHGAGDDWTATIEFIQIETGESGIFMKFIMGSSDPNLGPSRFVWPDEIPEYPDGAFEVSLEEERNSVYIRISNTSRESCEEYVDILGKAGWEFVGAYSERDWYFTKGERGVVLNLKDGEKDVGIIVLDD